MALIDNNKITEILAEVKASIDSEAHSNVGAIKYGIAIAIKEIGNAPIVEAEAVKQGEWIVEKVENTHSVFRCSKCGRTVEHGNTYYKKPSKFVSVTYPYCHCGAKMKCKEEEKS